MRIQAVQHAVDGGAHQLVVAYRIHVIDPDVIEHTGEEPQLFVRGQFARCVRLLRRGWTDERQRDGDQRDTERAAGLQITPISA